MEPGFNPKIRQPFTQLGADPPDLAGRDQLQQSALPVAIGQVHHASGCRILFGAVIRQFCQCGTGCYADANRQTGPLLHHAFDLMPKILIGHDRFNAGQIEKRFIDAIRHDSGRKGCQRLDKAKTHVAVERIV